MPASRLPFPKPQPPDPDPRRRVEADPDFQEHLRRERIEQPDLPMDF